MRRIVHLIAGLTAATALLLSGCSADTRPGIAQPVAGPAGGSSAEPTSNGPTSNGPSNGSTGPTDGGTDDCDERTYADPWIAFTPSLSDGDRLELGDSGWISGVSKVSDVEISGDAGVVVLSAESAPTEIACGEVVSSTYWVEVEAVLQGTVTLTTASGASMTITTFVS